MNTPEKRLLGAHGLPREIEEMILNLLKLSLPLPMSTVRTLFRIAALTYEAGIEAGLGKALGRIEETNTKIQSLMN